MPGLLYEGVSERDFFANLYTEMVKSGYQGISRFVMFDCDSFTGQVGFGVNSLYPSFFNGPGGQKGLNAAIPFLGDEKSLLVLIGSGVYISSQVISILILGKIYGIDGVAASFVIASIVQVSYLFFINRIYRKK